MSAGCKWHAISVERDLKLKQTWLFVSECTVCYSVVSY